MFAVYIEKGMKLFIVRKKVLRQKIFRTVSKYGFTHWKVNAPIKS